MRMKSAKASMSERTAVLVEPAAVVKLMVSSGVGAPLARPNSQAVPFILMCRLLMEKAVCSVSFVI